MAAPFIKAGLERCSDDEQQLYADTMVTVFASFSGDALGGYLYLPADPAAGSAAQCFRVAAIANHVGSPDGEFATVRLSGRVGCLDAGPGAILSCAEFLASLPVPDLGGWGKRLRQIDAGPVAAEEIPGAPGGGGPGQ
jgi:hypothetical protein